MRSLTQLLAASNSATPNAAVSRLLETEAGKLESMVTALLDLERLPLRDFHASSAVTDLGELGAARIDLSAPGPAARSP